MSYGRCIVGESLENMSDSPASFVDLCTSIAQRHRPRRNGGHDAIFDSSASSLHQWDISTWPPRRSASGGLSLSGNLNGMSSTPIPARVEEMGHGIVCDIYFMFLNPSIKVALLSSAPSSCTNAATSTITKEVFCLPSRLCLQFDALRH